MFDPARGDSGAYVKLSGDLLPQSGQGFWIIQVSDPLVILDLPSDSLPVSQGSNSESCVGLAGPCISIELPSTPGWMMLGNRHREAVVLGAIRVVALLAFAVVAVVYPQAERRISCRSLSILTSEVSRNYEMLVDVGLLNEWDGFWAFAGPNSVTFTHTLQVPLSR